MHFTRLRGSGFWTLSSAVDPAEFEAFDDRQFKSINGDEGGTWAPSSPIIVAGSGLVAEPFASEDIENAGFTGTVFFNGSSAVEFQNGSAVEVQTGSTWAIKTGATFTFDAGSVTDISGAVNLKTGGELTTDAGSTTVFNGLVAFDAAPLFASSTPNVVYIAPAIDGRYPPVAGGPFSSETLPDWGFSAAGLPQTVNNSQSTHWMWMRLPPLPRDATITGISVRADASAAGVRVVLPSTMPSFRLVRYAADGTRTVISTKVDPSVNLAAYEVPHDLDMTGLSEAVADRSYRLEFSGEYGANSESTAFWTVLSIELTYSANKVNHCHHEA